jgi:hypothetical protein
MSFFCYWGAITLRIQIAIACVLLLLAVGLAGCGGGSADTVHLKGKVTLDGEPVPTDAQASVTFQPTAGNKGKAVTAAIVNGAYDSPNTPRGPVLAIMSLSIPTGKMVMSERVGAEVPEINTVTLSQAQIGGIAIDVTGDETTHDFALTSAK